MTNPDDRGDDGLDGEGGAIAVLLRTTLAAVAETTTLDDRTAGSRTSPTTSRAGVPTQPPGVIAADDDVAGRRPAGTSRWWLATAAALALVVMGVVVAVGEQGYVSNGPVAPGEPSTAPAPASTGELSLIGPPRTVAGLELADVQVFGWSAADGDGVPETDPDNPVQPPLIAAGTSGVSVWFTYAPVGEAVDMLAPSLRIIVRTGVTMDLASAATGDELPTAVVGLRVLDTGVRCLDGSDPGATDPGSSAAPTASSTAEPAPDLSAGGGLSGACRALALGSTADRVVFVDGAPGAPITEAVAGLRVETLTELEARLGGVSDVGDIRRVLESLADDLDPATGAPETETESPAGP